MYFAGDQLLERDPIFNSVPDPQARERLLARVSIEDSRAYWALSFEFDIYLRGPERTPFEEAY
jgi:protocatechuate 3,4-dioxygenase beta subunit